MVYLPRGFGMHLNVANAIAVENLPGIRKKLIRVVGNEALADAMMSLTDRGALEERETCAHI